LPFPSRALREAFELRETAGASVAGSQPTIGAVWGLRPAVLGPPARSLADGKGRCAGMKIPVERVAPARLPSRKARPRIVRKNAEAERCETTGSSKEEPLTKTVAFRSALFPRLFSRADRAGRTRLRAWRAIARAACGIRNKQKPSTHAGEKNPLFGNLIESRERAAPCALHCVRQQHYVAEATQSTR
jgi:hypothetical protein